MENKYLKTAQYSSLLGIPKMNNKNLIQLVYTIMSLNQ